MGMIEVSIVSIFAGLASIMYCFLQVIANDRLGRKGRSQCSLNYLELC
jgi:hypothetical protein